MEQAALKEDDVYHVDMSVGEILRRTRVHYGQSIADVEKALHIRAAQIQIIENNDTESLPGRVYAIGFVRSYSEYLGLDGDKMVGLFKRQVGARSVDPALDFPIPASESRIPSVWLVVGSVIAVIIVVSVWWGFASGDEHAAREIKPVPVELTVRDDVLPTEEGQLGPIQPLEVKIAMKKEAAGLAMEQGREGIILEMRENSWVEIRDQNGRALVSRVLKAGDKYFVPDSPDLVMALGNAGGVLLRVDGAIMSPFGPTGEIKRNISLDRGFLKEHYSPAPDNAALKDITQE